MVLQGGPCGRVGRRRTTIPGKPPDHRSGGLPAFPHHTHPAHRGARAPTRARRQRRVAYMTPPMPDDTPVACCCCSLRSRANNNGTAGVCRAPLPGPRGGQGCRNGSADRVRADRGHFRDKASFDHAALPASPRFRRTARAPASHKRPRAAQGPGFSGHCPCFWVTHLTQKWT